MKRLLEFKAFESLSGLTEEQKIWLDKCTRTTNGWSIGPDGKVNVKGNFSCVKQKLSNFKGIQFGHVSGSFICSKNNLTSLEGAPETVGKDFECRLNLLESLEGSPKDVGGVFYCIDNRLKSLKGSPRTVGEGFYCFDNELNTLKGSPQSVGGTFACGNNMLTSLEGAPESVGGDFDCRENNLETLEGAPKEVGVSFQCEKNPLKTLVGAPEIIGRMFYSDSIGIPGDRWNFSGWMNVIEKGEPEVQKLLLTLFTPEELNKRLEESPEKTMVALKGVWNSPAFAKTRSQLKIPKGYEDEMDLLGDLDDIGL
jgi:hypothetical protein